jgi:hypothetical protein
LLQLSQPAAWLIAVGIVAGLAGSIATATLIRKLQFGTEPWDLGARSRLPSRSPRRIS